MKLENRKFLAYLKIYGAAILSMFLITALLLPFRSNLNSTTVSLGLLLGVLFIATLFGSRPAFLSSIVGIWCFNYFFLPPFNTLHIAELDNLVAFGAFLLTALIAGQLSGYARRRAEESEQRRREIERLYRELQAAFEQASQTEALRRSEKLKSSLLDAVTHDLRTPLTSIKASVTTLLEDRRETVLDEEAREEFLEIINEETDRLNEFIEGIVGIAKIEAGALHLRKNRSVVEEIVNNAVERAKNQLASHRISIEFAPDIPEILVDAHSISEVVYTLLDNAAKYSPKTSKIRISARRIENEMIEIAVEDQGCGVAGEMREKIFNKFFRVGEKDIHTTGSGLGLGLAIARGIVESQGGRIWVEDGSGEFKTRFAFQIPIG
jgi:two-component system sensor histidine kinase KdpD